MSNGGFFAVCVHQCSAGGQIKIFDCPETSNCHNQHTKPGKDNMPGLSFCQKLIHFLDIQKITGYEKGKEGNGSAQGKQIGEFLAVTQS